MPFAAARKTLVHLADGRELIYFDAEAGPDAARAAYPDTRPLDPGPGSGESRFDPLPDELIGPLPHRLRAAAAGPVPAGDLGQLPGRRVVPQRRVPLAHPGHRRALVRLRRPGRPAG